MGQSSFTDAENKNRSIAQCTSEHPDGQLPCYLLQPGGRAAIEELAYDGYLEMGGEDVFEWLRDANALESRQAALEIFYDEARYAQLLFPLKISYNKDAIYEQVGASYPCPHQGLPMRPDKAIAYDEGVDVDLLDDPAFEDVDFSIRSSIEAGLIVGTFTDVVGQLKGAKDWLGQYDDLSAIDKDMLVNSILSSSIVKWVFDVCEGGLTQDDIVSVLKTIGRDVDAEMYSRNAFDDVVIIHQERYPQLLGDTPSEEPPAQTDQRAPRVR